MPCGHNDTFSLFNVVDGVVDRDDALALKSCDECVTLRFVCADAFALGKSEECDSEPFILNKCLADNLSVRVGDLFLEQERLCMRNVV